MLNLSVKKMESNNIHPFDICLKREFHYYKSSFRYLTSAEFWLVTQAKPYSSKSSTNGPKTAFVPLSSLALNLSVKKMEPNNIHLTFA